MMKCPTISGVTLAADRYPAPCEYKTIKDGPCSIISSNM
jgi:hypothetical protein